MSFHSNTPDSPVPESESASQRSQASTSLPSWRQSDGEHSFPDPLLERIAARFRLLGDPLRLKLLALLTSEERSVGELVELTGAGQPNVSKHLAALTEGGLVRRRKLGTSTRYTIADPLVLTLCDIVCGGLYQQFVQQAHQLGWERNEEPKDHLV